MTPTSEELAAEQAYFDHAHKHRERRRALLGDAPAAAANPGAAKRLLAWMKRKESRPQQDPPEQESPARYPAHRASSDPSRVILNGVKDLPQTVSRKLTTDPSLRSG